MEISEDARKAIEYRIGRILKEVDVPEIDKNEIKKELMSNYVDASMVSARARGSATVEKADVASALETSEEPAEIASMYMASYANSLRRAGLLSRAVAYVIDTAITAVFTAIAALPFFMVRYLLLQTHEFDMQPLVLRFFYLLVIANLAIIFIYFTISEGFFSSTPGKWLLGLKVLRADGKRAGYREAMLRSIPKLFIAAIVADAAVMALYRRKDRQRLFDRIAGTIIIHK